MADNKIRRVVVAFEYRNGFYEGSAFTPFKPRGLVVWCDVPGATIEVQEGNATQGVAGFGRIPAQFFKQEDTTFEDLKKQLIEKGKDIPARWLDWDLMTPGQVVKILALTPGCEPIGPEQIQLLFWGHTVNRDAPLYNPNAYYGKMATDDFDGFDDILADLEAGLAPEPPMNKLRRVAKALKKPSPKPAHVMVQRPDGTVEDPVATAPSKEVRSTLGISLGAPRNLQRGDAGDDVKAWQMFCNSKTMRDELGRFAGPVPTKLVEDGIFGEETQLYTIRVQQRIGILDDGIVGPATRMATLRLMVRAANEIDAASAKVAKTSPVKLNPPTNPANIAASPAKNAEPPEPVEAWSTPSWDDVS